MLLPSTAPLPIIITLNVISMYEVERVSKLVTVPRSKAARSNCEN
jgi:hypothetical protein